MVCSLIAELDGLDLVAALLARSWNVIVKLHDRSRDPRPFYSGGVDWVGKLEQMMAKAPGHLVADADICPYLAAADVMITDHSSAGFEYLLLDRPLVRIDVPELLRHSNTNEEATSGCWPTPRDRRTTFPECCRPSKRVSRICHRFVAAGGCARALSSAWERYCSRLSRAQTR